MSFLMPYTTLRLHTTSGEPTFGDFRKSGFFRVVFEGFSNFSMLFEGPGTFEINSDLEREIPRRMV